MQVEQIDREAAASGYYAWCSGNPVIPERMTAGTADDHSMVQAFARHRLSGDAAGYARAVGEIVAWLRQEQNTCDCSAHCANECACGAWDDWKTVAVEPLVDRLEAEFTSQTPVQDS